VDQLKEYGEDLLCYQLAEWKGYKVMTASRHDATDVNIMSDPQFSKFFALINCSDVIIHTVGNPVLMRAALGILAARGSLSYITARQKSTVISFDMTQLYRKEQGIVGCNFVNNTWRKRASW
jgi:NADPH:quinone reductase